MKVWINGENHSAEDPIIKAGDLALHRGFGIFDFFRVVAGQPLLYKDHLARLRTSATLMGLDVPYSDEELHKHIVNLIAVNQLHTGGVKLTLTGGYAADGYTPTSPNLIITTHQTSGPPPEKYQQGFKAITEEYQREMAQCKTINYLKGITLLPKMKELGVDDALLHFNGVVTEFPRSNFFMVTPDGEIHTAAEDVLHGITRKSILRISPYPVHQRQIKVQELTAASEMFLTSTLKKVMPLVELDGKPIGDGTPGPVTRQLMEELDRFQSSVPAAID